MKRVVVGLMTDGCGRVLLQQRAFDAVHFPGQWESPGGKVERGETDAQALAREWLEELDAHVSVGHGIVTSGLLDIDGSTYYLVMYRVRALGDPAKITKFTGAGLGWFTADEVRVLEMASLNADYRERLVELLRDEVQRAEARVPGAQVRSQPSSSVAYEAAPTRWPGHGPIVPPDGAGWEPFAAVSGGGNGYALFWRRLT